MVDQKAPPSKQGLHGWKAAAAVLGCGSAAAFGLFGVVLVVLSFIANTLSSGVGPSEETPAAAAPPPSPRQSFDFDKFDLCNDTLTSIRSLNLTLEESGEGPVDTAIEGGEWNDDNLVRADSCRGTLIPDSSYVEPWEIDFSYRAIIFAPKGERDELAQSDLVEWKEDAEDSDLAISESGSVDFSDESYFVYANPEDGLGSSYSLVARKRSGIFRVDLSSGESTSRAAFENEIRKIVERLDFTLANRIPE
ncbi:hypothetical protein ABZ512_10680 [Nocardiopsis dassonvillei]|uniref:hypothetical protein n=1 Tax=Nocardiopsis dassonvillei TaxID=2014 RepID=UPI0033DF272C